MYTAAVKAKFKCVQSTGDCDRQLSIKPQTEQLLTIRSKGDNGQTGD